jgi:protein-S-isoprenylcysteine O-methyltransferase Ste14
MGHCLGGVRKVRRNRIGIIFDGGHSQAQMLSSAWKIFHLQGEYMSCPASLNTVELIRATQVSIRRQHRLVTGPFPYDVVRHPSYTGLTFIAIGIGLRTISSANSLHFPHLFRLQKHLASIAQFWLTSKLKIDLDAKTVATAGSLMFGVMILAGQMKLINARVQVEEKALREEFGEEYDRYCRRTWKYFPGW